MLSYDREGQIISHHTPKQKFKEDVTGLSHSKQEKCLVKPFWSMKQMGIGKPLIDKVWLDKERA